jgi:cystathionine beta-lyase/cystathionine gamma-synthase
MSQHLDTLLVHAGEPEPRHEGAVGMPVFSSANYLFAGEERYEDLKYIRLNNTPNHRALGEKLAAAEGAEAATVTASGMAAITTALLSCLSQGDHLLAQDCLYGGTYSFLQQDGPRFGITTSFVAGSDPSAWKASLKPETRAFYVEAMSNPLLEVADLEAVVSFCREYGLVSMIDATFSTPYNFRPLELGFDLVLHSATKYLNGHSDIVAGVVAGSHTRLEKVVHLLNHLGGSLDPHACVLLHRGLKTLGLRMERHNANGQAVSEFLHGHDKVARVYYAGLPSHPGHDRAKRLFRGFGGVFSFELEAGVEGAERVMSRLKLPLVAPSLGGVESLITRPATTSHAGMTAEQRAGAGIRDGLIRVALGIEDPRDLVEDFRQALEQSV